MIDFQNTKRIFIPEGEVAVIACGEEILWQKQTSRLPFEYQEVAYLEGTGTQYINTGMYAPLNTDIKVRFQINNTAQGASNNGAIFGGRSAQTSQTCTLFYIASANPQYFRLDRTGQVPVATANQISIDTESVYEFDYANNTATIRNLTAGEEVTKTIGAPSSFTNNQIQLFAVGSGTVFKGKVFEWEYWENGELVQHFIPCCRKNDGKPGMYDLVTETFFTNAGSGEFAYGSSEI